MAILVTGATGYIGSHMLVNLLNQNYQVIAMDNLSNSSYDALKRVESITAKTVPFYKTSLLDKEGLRSIFELHEIDAVIHFAGLKAVGESVQEPHKYYENNISGTLNLCEIMRDFSVKKLVFSSSATVYGNPVSVPITEDFPVSATNPYGRTKLFIEYILKDLSISDPSWSIAILRYFNPIGAHKSGMIGEDPNGIPNNLMPYIAQVAVGKRPYLSVFGDDYSTADGTGVRDYIHVLDLTEGHLKALEKLAKNKGVYTYNLGTGNGSSVLEIIKTFEKVSGKNIPFKIEGRRAGDVAKCYADPSLAAADLGWKTKYDLEEMCGDVWNWQSKNPNGYKRA